MKKKCMGLVALWLALLFTVMIPFTALAETSYRLYTGSTPLVEGDYVEGGADTVPVSVTKDSPLNTQEALTDAVTAPSGNMLSGWRIWSVNESGFISQVLTEDKAPDGTISATEEGLLGEKALIEPLFTGIYRISEQPKAENDYTVKTEKYENDAWRETVEEDGAVYAWYPSVQKTFTVIEGTATADEIAIESNFSGTFAEGAWSSENGNINILIALEAGDIIRVTPSAGFAGSVCEYGGEALTNTDGVYTYSAATAGAFDLQVEETDGTFTAVVEVVREVHGTEAVSGQTTATYTGGTGRYFCRITFPETTLESDTIGLYDFSASYYSGTYDGADHEAVQVSGLMAGCVTEYSTDNVTFSETVPTVRNATEGTTIYVRVSVGSDVWSDMGTVVIEKATPVLSAPSASTIASGNRLRNATLSGGSATGVDGMNLPGTFTWENGDRRVYVSGNQTVVFTPEDTENYTTAEINVRVTVRTTASPQGGSYVRSFRTVQFDTNGGSKIEPVTVERNTPVSEPTAPTKDGATFDGWYMDKNLTGAYDFELPVSQDITLYAKWTEADGGEQDKEAWENPYSDVKDNDWFKEAVEFVDENGLMDGEEDGAFNPNGYVKRWVFLVALYRHEGAPESETANPFTDVTFGTELFRAVTWGYANGIIKGVSETEFAPDMQITREQMVAILHRYMTYKNVDVTSNADLSVYADEKFISEYAVEPMRWAVENEIIEGVSEKEIEPLGTSTRAQVAMVLKRVIERMDHGLIK